MSASQRSNPIRTPNSNAFRGLAVHSLMRLSFSICCASAAASLGFFAPLAVAAAAALVSAAAALPAVAVLPVPVAVVVVAAGFAAASVAVAVVVVF